MPVYAATSPAFAGQRMKPRTLALIVTGHAALLALAMSAKMDMPIIDHDGPLVVQPIPVPQSPPEPEPQPQAEPRPSESVIDRMPVVVPIPLPQDDPIESRPIPTPDPGPVIGPRIDPLPRVDPLPVPPVRVGPRFATPDHWLKPPYPLDKLRGEEEATLRLRLAIDARGRVTAVEPVGTVDQSFLEAARKHLLARWRYKPATEGSRPVASSTVITLRFELEG